MTLTAPTHSGPRHVPETTAVSYPKGRFFSSRSVHGYYVHDLSNRRVCRRSCQLACRVIDCGTSASSCRARHVGLSDQFTNCPPAVDGSRLFLGHLGALDICRSGSSTACQGHRVRYNDLHSKRGTNSVPADCGSHLQQQ